MTRITKTIFALVLFGAMASANAQNVFLTPSDSLIDPGAMVTLDVEYNFDDVPTVGGALDAFWDPSILQLVSWEFGPDSGDPVFNVMPDDSVAGTLFQFGFGNFPALPNTGVAFSMTFMAVGAGTTMVTIGETTGPFGGFPEFDPTFTGASVSVVPVPAAVWLMFGGLSALIGFGRRS